MYSHNTTWELLQISYYYFIIIAHYTTIVTNSYSTHTHTAGEVGTWDLQQKPVNTTKRTTVIHHITHKKESIQLGEATFDFWDLKPEETARVVLLSAQQQ